MKLHFAYRQIGLRMERYMNAELSDVHTGPLNAIDDPHIGCTLNITPGRELSATPYLPACTRDCHTVYPSSWTVSKE
ncbi:hypothetical protein TNCV_603251 [Trichonephila clavipes]|nr:hypothetical protein TNCV_603251 [Trichonephila clavipes]